MRRFGPVAILFIIVFSLTACTQVLAQSGTVARPAVYVQYHVWYKTADKCPASSPTSDWSHWAWWSESNNPCNTTGAPWLRDISSPGYPLAGPYESSSADVFRWHIRLAKAAGIDGFFVSLFPGAPEASTNLQNFEVMLRVAQEENFKLGMEGWTPWEPFVSVDAWLTDVKKQIDYAVNSAYSSALLKINGKPAYWFVYWTRFMSVADLVAKLLNTRSVFWVIGGPLNLTELDTIKRQLNTSELTQNVEYNYPTTDGCVFNEIISGLSTMKGAGLLAFAHGYPGFDERALTHESGRNPPRYCSRNNGRTVTDLLNYSAEGGAHAILFESWNDYLEYTQFEPGLDVTQYRDLGQELIYSGDPYRYLKLLADFKGIPFVAPTLDCAILDPLLQQHGVVQCGAPIVAPPTAPSGLIIN